MKKQSLNRLAWGLLLGILCGLSAVHAATVLIKAESATLREKASTKAKALDTLKQYEPVTLLEKNADWAKVKSRAGKEGYVLARLVSKVGFVSTNEDQANVRRGPGSDYAIIMNYGRNFPLRVLDVAGNGWLKVMDFEGDRGWVSPKTVDAEPVYVITKEKQVNLRQEPVVTAQKVFSAEKGVIFQALEEKDGWLKVKHPDGDAGWVSAKIVYGWLDVEDPSPKNGQTEAKAEKSKTTETAGKKDEAKSTTRNSSKSSSKSSGKTSSGSSGKTSGKSSGKSSKSSAKKSTKSSD
jgi:SH3-like domain-containing protein